MAFFGLSDISFDKGPPTRNGPLGDLVNSEFKTSTLRYPLDVGNYDKGHYMVFYIRQQKRTSAEFARATVSDDIINQTGGVSSGGVSIQNAQNDLLNSVANEINGALNKVTSGLNQIASQVSQALGGRATPSNLFGTSSIQIGGSSAASQKQFDTSFKKITGGSTGLLRTTELTKDAIALYMPDTLLYSHNQSYDQLSLGKEGAGQVLAAGKSALEEYEKTGSFGEAGESVLKSAGETVLQKGVSALGTITGSPQTAQAILAATGRVANPMLEMVYTSPGFRTFQFDFTFYPRDEKEALEVQNIVERFRFHQAPELLEGAGGFLIPPSEFDIRFYYGGNLNPNIPGIATCVLTTIDLNYAPNGFAAYEVPGVNTPGLGGTGMPVAIQMTLQFQETTFLTKSDFNKTGANSDTQDNTTLSQAGRFGPK